MFVYGWSVSELRFGLLVLSFYQLGSFSSFRSESTDPPLMIIIIIYLLILCVLHVQMLTRALQYNNLTVHTQIKKKNYIVHFVTMNIEEEKNLKLQQFTVFTVFILIKITTVLILLKLRYL